QFPTSGPLAADVDVSERRVGYVRFTQRRVRSVGGPPIGGPRSTGCATFRRLGNSVRDPGVEMHRVAAVAAVVLGLLVFSGATASAEAPLRVTGDITDPAGALQNDTSAVQAALQRLTAETNLRLYVVYVKNFSGRDGQDWAD